MFFTFALVLLLGGACFWIFRRRIRGILDRRFDSSESAKVLLEDALKHLHAWESRNESPTVQSLAGELTISADKAAEVLSRLHERGLVEIRNDRFALTESGKEYAVHMVRAHRLWERYLADRTGLSETEWHEHAHRLEHQLSRQEVEELSARLGNPTHDPHGDPVPTSSGRFSQVEGQTLHSLEPGDPARIVHIEDEPRSVFAQLVDLGLHPGMEIRAVEKSDEEIVIRSEGAERTLSVVAAGNVTVRRTDATEEVRFENSCKLSGLQPGQKGRVLLISKASRAVERRRFMDLGILPGTVIEAELAGPGGDPVAYRIRGALIALRREQADHIYIEPLMESAA